MHCSDWCFNQLPADFLSGTNFISADFPAALRIGRKTELLKAIGRSENRPVLADFRPVYMQL